MRLNRQNGKVVVLALIVSLVIALQTISILETSWRDRRLFNQRQLAVQTRQAVFSVSSATLRKFAQPAWRSSVFNRLRAQGNISMCLNSQGRLVSRCDSSSFTRDVGVMATLEPLNTAFIDLSGDNWSYIKMTSQGTNSYQTLRELIKFAVETTSGEVRVQQRYWIKGP